jgi:hypothetical protein
LVVNELLRPGVRRERLSLGIRLSYRETAAEEAVQPAIVELAVVAHVAAQFSEVGFACATAPVEGSLRIEEVGDGEVVAHAFDVAAIRRAVSNDVADADVRRDDSAPASAADVLEEKRQPHHGDVADVEHCWPRDDERARSLDLVRLEVVVGDGVVAGGDGSVGEVVVGVVGALDRILRRGDGVSITSDVQRLTRLVDRRRQSATSEAFRREVVGVGASREDRRLTRRDNEVALS